MRSPFFRAAALLALMAWSSLALADTPARVGRISLVQGSVTIAGEDGDEPSGALVNWPVTTDNRITTERNARTEIRVGSTAVRLDGDSSLEVLALDDDNLRLHLHYGSASIRIRNAEALDGFEIGTPHGRVRMREPGRLRVDAERTPDTSVVDVFEGLALVDSAGSTLSVRAGRRAEMHDDNLATALAVRGSFDDWARLRDQQDERVTSDRYVTTEMTGYEDLDRHGSWREDSEYGPLWLPRAVPAGWAPYRDGRWVWVAPWGWTWIDNAPWGYAPFHYGRWVMVNQRWCWAPGRNIGRRPVWAPALVGWVGGSGWSLAFHTGSLRRPAPAQGWYPLGPGEQFVPDYRVSHDHLRHINRHARVNSGRDIGDHQRRHGLTVVPHEHFNRRVPVLVPQAPRAVVTPLALQTAPVMAPPAPLPSLRDRPNRRHRDDDYDRSNRRYRDEDYGRPSRRHREDGSDRPEGVGYRVTPQPQPVMPTPVPATVQAPPPAVLTTHPPLVEPQPRREWRTAPDERRDWRGARDERRGQAGEPRHALPQPAPQPVTMPAPPPVAMPAPQRSAPPAAAPAPPSVPVSAMPAPSPVPAAALAPAPHHGAMTQDLRRQQVEEQKRNSKRLDVKLD